MLAERVVDGERALGAAHGHVHLERAHELASGDPAVLGLGALVARAVVQAPLLGAERVDRGRRRAHEPVSGIEQRPASVGQLAHGGRHVAVGRGHELDLRGRQLQLEAAVAGQAPEHLRRSLG